MAHVRSAIIFTRWALARPVLVLLALLALLPSAPEGGATRLRDIPRRVVAVAAVAAAPDGEAVGPASRHQSNEAEQAPLRTVGGASPSLTGETEQALRSQSGSLLAATDSAWNHLTRNERAILLDGWVSWTDYDAAIADEPELQELLAAVIEGTEALTGDGVVPQDLDINAIVLELPAAKLGPALAEEEPEPIAIGPDVVLLVDDVVVAQIVAAANLVPEAPRGEIDDRGLIDTDPPSAAAEEAAPDATESTAPHLKRSAAGDPIPRIALEELPTEAIETLILIYQGGPFPFERDGATFGNFEERLPAAADGYYREYTVITPGSDDRGARRIVTGNNDTEFYYTDDHYETFFEVIITEE